MLYVGRIYFLVVFFFFLGGSLGPELFVGILKMGVLYVTPCLGLGVQKSQATPSISCIISPEDWTDVYTYGRSIVTGMNKFEYLGPCIFSLSSDLH